MTPDELFSSLQHATISQLCFWNEILPVCEIGKTPVSIIVPGSLYE